MTGVGFISFYYAIHILNPEYMPTSLAYYIRSNGKSVTSGINLLSTEGIPCKELPDVPGKICASIKILATRES